LAYTVKKHKYGYYVLIRFDAPPTSISPLERTFKLKEHVIKYLTVKIIETKKKTDAASLSSIKDKTTPNEISKE
jgi:small subunit ribosomal protein S6